VTTIHIDIETCPSQSETVKAGIAAGITPPGNMSKAETISAWEKEKKPALVEEAWRKTSFDGALGHICVIGAAIDNNDPVTFWQHNWKDSESDVIAQFYIWLTNNVTEMTRMGSQWVGHNVIDFDLRFLFQRSVIHALEPPYFIPRHTNSYSDRVFDTMTAWAGRRDRISLDKLCRVMGIAGKGSELGGDDIDGCKVWDFVSAGRIADVATYCAGDVIRVREIYKRMTFAR